MFVWIIKSRTTERSGSSFVLEGTNNFLVGQTAKSCNPDTTNLQND